MKPSIENSIRLLREHTTNVDSPLLVMVLYRNLGRYDACFGLLVNDFMQEYVYGGAAVVIANDRGLWGHLFS